MTRLADQLSALLGDAFSTMELDPSLGRVSESDRPDLAPYQCNGAMAAAKAAGKPPRAIAEAVKAFLAGTAPDLDIEIAGPGFLNITPSPQLYTARARVLAGDDRTGAGHARCAEECHDRFLADPMSPSRCMSAICAHRSLATACSGFSASWVIR